MNDENKMNNLQNLEIICCQFSKMKKQPKRMKIIKGSGIYSNKYIIGNIIEV